MQIYVKGLSVFSYAFGSSSQFNFNIRKEFGHNLWMVINDLFYGIKIILILQFLTSKYFSLPKISMMSE